MSKWINRLTDLEWVHHLNPSVILAVCIYGLYYPILFSALALHELPIYAYLPAGLIQTLLVFLAFTLIHDGSHHSISRNPRINEVVLLLCWPMFLNNPILFRKLHWQHHSNVNDPIKDPDHFTASRTLGGRWFKSFFLIFYYIVFGVRNFKSAYWRMQITLSVASSALVLLAAIVTPLTWPIIFVWVLPAFFGIGLLAYMNTSLPHHPARETDRYRNTSNSYMPWFLQLLMLNQNLHLAHHLRPKMPWYEYPEYWKRNKAEIMQNGGRVLIYTDRKEPYALIPSWVQEVIKEVRQRIDLFNPW
ncbi:MAG: hypothetical protein COV44_01075 [Deltaproteobacteria bacterium CG11_big_fil_rev_8_21_14_0_20_45_16]|nr:MAG: hypothetical protein COV44_01075 [Deltaproteobacteria bacterium CG11_big_fil_rev_8_21_14_0_20_45_16]